MTAQSGDRSAERAVPLRLVVPAVVLPLGVFAVLTAVPTLNPVVLLPVGHFFGVTTVSLLSAGVALLLARAALRMEQWRVALLAVGFMAMAALFAVHALATPGVLPAASVYDDTYRGTVVGVSASLSLFVPALLFGAGFSGLVPAARRRALRAPRWGVGAVVAGLVAYAAVAVYRPQAVAGMGLADPPASYLLAAVSVALLAFAARRQLQSYVGTRLPMQGALVVAFLFLAQAQIIMVFSTFWTLAWWEYHVLMFAAVVLALGGLFIELDRRRGLERFLAPEVVERVVAGDLVRLAGERRTVTVLFADLRGSTVLAERLDAAAVVGLVNDYVGAMARSVFAHGGMLDKFLGDGLMALFGVLPDPSDGVVPAVRSALEMRRALATLNDARRAGGQAAIGFGVGIHTGEVVLGAIGIPQRSEFTAIGDTVNTAARLQELTKEFEVDVVLSEAAAERLRGAAGALRELGSISLRGRTQPVRAFTLGAVARGGRPPEAT